MRKAVSLITGASGEIGHGLITRLAQAGSQPIVTLDLNPLDPEPAVRAKGLDFLKRVLDNAATLGAAAMLPKPLSASQSFRVNARSRPDYWAASRR